MPLVFWLCVALVVYTYLGYPLLLALVARRWKRPVQRAPFVAPVSIVLAAHNEEHALSRRLGEFIAMLDRDRIDGEIIVVSDGSTDGTAANVSNYPDRRVRLVVQPERAGKAAALNAGCAAAKHDILVFADMRQNWADDAISKMLENFADPAVGAVSGELQIETAAGTLAGVGLYWRFEKWLRRTESSLHSCIGVTGAICAVRRGLFRPIPVGTILDDVYWPLNVIMQGQRVVFDGRAVAHDRLPPRSRDELRRKVRTLAGNFQLAMRLPSALLPWRNPLCLQFVSHKLLRLAVPWALLGMLLTSALTPSPLYRMFFQWQLAGYAVGLLGLCPPVALRSRLASAGASFLVLNSAAWLAFWVWITGRSQLSWHKVQYQPQTQAKQTSQVGSVA